ncbi:MAG TPA: hypothetical protein VEQ60_15915 [Longimicrobium sp.]|nr:hypothetical protein [Longimicrobium sp.]
MRLAYFVTLSWLAAAFAGCGSRERAAGEASATPSVDTVVPTIIPITDTAGPARTEILPPDDCRYTDARPRTRIGDPGHWELYDSTAMARGVEYRCALRPQGPEVRLVVRGESGIPMAVDVHSPPEAGRPLQRLLLDNDERAREGNDLVIGEDLNGDGWTDLRVQTFSGQGGVVYDVFLYAPTQRAFVPDTVLSSESWVHRLAGEPCAGTSHKMALGVWSSAAYCWKGGRWILTRTVSQDRAEHGGYIRTHRELRGDTLRVVRVDTLADPNL